MSRPRPLCARRPGRRSPDARRACPRRAGVQLGKRHGIGRAVVDEHDLDRLGLAHRSDGLADEGAVVVDRDHDGEARHGRWLSSSNSAIMRGITRSRRKGAANASAPSASRAPARLVRQQRDDRLGRLGGLAGHDDARETVDLVEVAATRRAPPACRTPSPPARRWAGPPSARAGTSRARVRACGPSHRPRRSRETTPPPRAPAGARAPRGRAGDGSPGPTSSRRRSGTDARAIATAWISRSMPLIGSRRPTCASVGRSASAACRRRRELQRQRHVDERLLAGALGDEIAALVARGVDERRRLAQRAPAPQPQEHPLDQRLAAIGGRRHAAHRLHDVRHARADRRARGGDAEHGVQVVQEHEVEGSRVGAHPAHVAPRRPAHRARGQPVADVAKAQNLCAGRQRRCRRGCARPPRRARRSSRPSPRARRRQQVGDHHLGHADRATERVRGRVVGRDQQDAHGCRGPSAASRPPRRRAPARRRPRR